MNELISIIIPSFNEEKNIPLLLSELLALKEFKFEIIFVNDGSGDRSLEVLREIASKYEEVKCLSFSRNFGHQNAIKAGLDYAVGDAVIMMDADLQHPPSLVPVLIKKWREGSLIVSTIRIDNESISFFKKVTSKTFYFLINKISRNSIHPASADFRIIDRKVVDCLRGIRCETYFWRGLIPWTGFSTSTVEYQAQDRAYGESQYTFKKMFKLAVSGVISTSNFPLYLSIWLGFFMSGLSFLYGLYAVVIKVFFEEAVSGWTSIVFSIVLIGGIQLIILGIIGFYLAQVFERSKRTPNYIVEEKINF